MDESANPGVDGVIITGELDRRPSRAPDYEAESRALTSLAEAMSSSPGTVLQRLVEEAMELTRSDSAGISLLEPGGEQGTFRWVATAGAWTPYRDGTMPREESPCGEVMVREAVLLVDKPERVFPALLQAEPGIREGLLAPFHIAGEPVGTVWAIKHDPEGHFEAEDARILTSLARFASAAHQVVRARTDAEAGQHKSDTRLRESEARQRFLLTLSDELRPLTAPADIAGLAVARLGEQFGLSRVFYGEITGHQMMVERDYTNGVPSLVGEQSLEAFGQRFLAAYRAGAVIAVSDVEADTRINEEAQAVLRARQVAAFVDVVLFEEGQCASLLAVQSARVRRWTPAEEDLFREVGERVKSAIERARTEAALRDSEARFRQFSDASTNVLWIRNAATLRMEFASPAFDTIYGIPGPNHGGDDSLRSWARLIEPESRPKVLANFRRVRAGERVELEFRFRRASDGALRWAHNTDFPLRDARGEVRWIAGLGADITDAKEAADRQAVLVAELQHRTRNLIAVVRSLSDRTLGNAASLEDFGKRFRLRLSALSRVQGLLSHLAAGERVTFDELLRTELAAHGATDGMASKVRLDGPVSVPLRSSTVQTLALALHELATNAVKYGALSVPDGHLTVRWHVEPGSGDDAPRLHVEWQESGVVMPHVGAAPRGTGYGRELIERALPYQLKAKTSYELGADGVRCTIAVPISRTASEGD